MASKVVAIYALPLALLSLILGVRVTLIRTSLKASVGDAGHPALRKCNRQHGNLVERTPWVVLPMALAKVNGAGTPWLQAGRLIHPVYIKVGNAACPRATSATRPARWQCSW